MNFFEGAEHSWIEFAEALFLLALILYTIRKLIAGFANPDETFLINAVVVGLLFLMLGRELSYGKYHGVEHGVRTTLRILSFVAVLGFWVWSAYFARHGMRSAVSSAIRRVNGERYLIATMIILFIVSQIIDKDLFYVIRPPEIAQAAEESIEAIAYLLLSWILVRLNVKSSNQ